HFPCPRHRRGDSIEWTDRIAGGILAGRRRAARLGAAFAGTRRRGLGVADSGAQRRTLRRPAGGRWLRCGHEPRVRGRGGAAVRAAPRLRAMTGLRFARHSAKRKPDELLLAMTDSRTHPTLLASHLATACTSTTASHTLVSLRNRNTL